MDKLQCLLTVDEVALYLKVKPTTIQKWVYLHMIPSIKVGRNRRFEPDEIRKWLKRRSEGKSA